MSDADRLQALEDALDLEKMRNAFLWEDRQAWRRRYMSLITRNAEGWDGKDDRFDGMNYVRDVMEPVAERLTAEGRAEDAELVRQCASLSDRHIDLHVRAVCDEIDQRETVAQLRQRLRTPAQVAIDDAREAAYRKRLTDELDEFNRRCAGQPYRPSNGTEGMIFEADHCERCVHEGGIEPGDAPPCDIACRAVAYMTTDPQYPSEWIYAADGSGPTCTAFVARAGE